MRTSTDWVRNGQGGLPCIVLPMLDRSPFYHHVYLPSTFHLFSVYVPSLFCLCSTLHSAADAGQVFLLPSCPTCSVYFPSLFCLRSISVLFLFRFHFISVLFLFTFGSVSVPFLFRFRSVSVQFPGSVLFPFRFLSV